MGQTLKCPGSSSLKYLSNGCSRWLTLRLTLGSELASRKDSRLTKHLSKCQSKKTRNRKSKRNRRNMARILRLGSTILSQPKPQTPAQLPMKLISIEFLIMSDTETTLTTIDLLTQITCTVSLSIPSFSNSPRIRIRIRIRIRVISNNKLTQLRKLKLKLKRPKSINNLLRS